jgi:hypothetical protein
MTSSANGASKTTTVNVLDHVVEGQWWGGARCRACVATEAKALRAAIGVTGQFAAGAGGSSRLIARDERRGRISR